MNYLIAKSCSEIRCVNKPLDFTKIQRPGNTVAYFAEIHTINKKVLQQRYSGSIS